MTREYLIKENTVVEPEREIPIVRRVGVIVVGGGIAGLVAAVVAARNGIDTLLIERNGFLGGTATAGLMTLFTIPYDYMDGMTKEIVDRMAGQGGAVKGRVVPFDLETFKKVALEMIEEAGVRLLLYSLTVDAITVGNQIKGVIIENKSGRQALLGQVVIDATGDGDVAVAAGVPYVKGREKDGKMRPMTIIFRMGNVNYERLWKYWKENPDQFSPDPGHNVFDLGQRIVRLDGFFDLVAQAREKGELDPNCHYLRLYGIINEVGTVFVNSTRVYAVDGIDVQDLTRAELEARKQMSLLVGFIKKHVPGFESSYLIDSATNMGVRETRRIIGEYILNLEDISQDKKFDDRIARKYEHQVPGVEIHSPEAAEGAPNDAYVRKLILPLRRHDVPYSCLVPKNIENLLVAGRCISVTHEADSWTRGMPSCIATGQAAGTAAALAVKAGVMPRRINVSDLQKLLKDQGVNLD